MFTILNTTRLRVLGLILGVVLSSAVMNAGDWPDWRGPARDGASSEKGLPTSWSPAGENLAWKAPYGGRSTPIIFGDRLYLQNSVGKDATLQERILCLNADTGKVLWEHRFNMFLSDVPPHRIGWASPVGDPATGNIFAFGGGGTLLSLSKQGKVLWEISLSENFGLVTTHGGRTASPVIEGDLVIVSGITSGWGNQARGSHRFLAFDKKNGQAVWVNSPGGRPFDTTYSPPIAAEISGTRLLIAGGGDGGVHALKPQTGEPVWSFSMSKRGINTGVVLKGNTAIVSHGEENLDTSEMGLLAAVDASAKGDLGKEQVQWALKGFLGGYSSPVLDGDRVYQIDNGSNLYAFDISTGKELWRQNLGTIQKSSLVLAEGRLYVGTENGRFFILKPGPTGCQILDEDALGTETHPEEILASVAVSNGRIFLVSSESLYCIGKKSTSGSSALRPPAPEAGSGPATYVQVVPTELLMKPGESVQFKARLFDSKGRFLKEHEAAWSLEGLKGTIKDGRFTPATDGGAQAGQVKATIDKLSGVARARIAPPLPWDEDFDSVVAVPAYWINATGKFAVREVEQKKVLVKLADNPFTKRARVFMGPSDLSDYTVEVDVLATEKRRQMGDAGVVAQRYALILFGNHQRLELQPWQPETHRTVTKPFPWKSNTWYRMKLQVENLPDGKTRARGKVWPAADSEPPDWTIEKIDPIPNKQGSPGIYADAHYEIFFDNLKVAHNP